MTALTAVLAAIARFDERWRHGALCDYDTADTLRPATAEEAFDSATAAEGDGGRGVIDVDGRRCYVDPPTGPSASWWSDALAQQ